MATPDSRDTTEVNVDAITGEVLNISKEKPESEDAEKKKEGEKHETEEKDKD